MVQEIWQKFNANERLAASGSIVVIVSWLIGLIGSYGFGTGVLVLLAAIAVLAVYYLKYAPNQSMNWPAPIPTVVLAVSAIAALFAVLSALQWLSLGFSFVSVLFTLAVIGTAVGALIMLWGAWQEYQAMPKTTPSNPAATPPPSAPPPAPPSASS